MYIKSGKIGLFKTVNALIIAIAGFFAFGNLLFSVFTLTSEEFGTNCPTCAAALKIRANTLGTCPFCGKELFVPYSVQETTGNKS